MASAPTTGIDPNRFKPYDPSGLTKEQRDAISYLESEGFKILGRRAGNSSNAIFVYHPGYDHYTSIHSGRSGVQAEGMVVGMRRMVARLKKRSANTSWLVIEHLRKKYDVGPLDSKNIQTTLRGEAEEAKREVPELAGRSLSAISVALSQSTELKTVTRAPSGSKELSTFLLFGRHYGVASDEEPTVDDAKVPDIEPESKRKAREAAEKASDDALLEEYGFRQHGKSKVRDPRGGMFLRHDVLHRLRSHGNEADDYRQLLREAIEIEKAAAQKAEEEAAQAEEAMPQNGTEPPAEAKSESDTDSLSEDKQDETLSKAVAAMENGSYGGWPGDFRGIVEPEAPNEVEIIPGTEDAVAHPHPTVTPFDPDDMPETQGQWRPGDDRIEIIHGTTKSRGGGPQHRLDPETGMLYRRYGPPRPLPEPDSLVSITSKDGAQQREVERDVWDSWPEEGEPQEYETKPLADILAELAEKRAEQAQESQPTVEAPDPTIALPGVPSELQGAIQGLLRAYSTSTENERVKLSLVQEELMSARDELRGQLDQLMGACKAISKSITTVDGLLKLIGES